MGMPCEVNSILKLTPAQGYPAALALGKRHTVEKSGYRILPMDAPIPLVDELWLAHADICICRLAWETQTTIIEFEVSRLYDGPFSVRG